MERIEFRYNKKVQAAFRVSEKAACTLFIYPTNLFSQCAGE
ncbi:hypothetical protein HMPREF0476_1264 [Kingella kingae ATCC 23330]|uniref:Uncharacterized protein n=1 Tax=Kingella kingae ATCC 23330 TaxID=887327 RepID=F5S7T1_KINKI|nr:hypothetical protein HMPREF0476_1264 [Kingella kingae ATCC 23330]